MAEFKTWIIVAALTAVAFPFSAAWAGLDLENQREIHIGALDLDRDGRISRKEAAEYMFFYFDHDGNEVLTKGEYHRKRKVSVVPYEGDEITVIDLDNDGQDDGVSYTTDTFLEEVMVGDYDPEDDGIKAYTFMDIYFLRLDSDKSRSIELDEWQKAYEKHAVIKPNMSPKAAKQDRYN